MKPLFWRVSWAQHPDGTPAGFRDYAQRAAARGFAMMRRASGFTVDVAAVFNA